MSLLTALSSPLSLFQYSASDLWLHSTPGRECLLMIYNCLLFPSISNSFLLFLRLLIRKFRKLKVNYFYYENSFCTGHVNNLKWKKKREWEREKEKEKEGREEQRLLLTCVVKYKLSKGIWNPGHSSSEKPGAGQYSNTDWMSIRLRLQAKHISRGKGRMSF